MTAVNLIGLVVVLSLGLTVALYQLTRWTDPEQDAELSRIDMEIDAADAFARQLEQLRNLAAAPI